MSTTIIMPQLGESVAEGVIGKWLKKEGDEIGKDEPIVEVITDKVNAEIPSPVAGTLLRVMQAEGATVAVGEPIALIGSGVESDAGSGGGENGQVASSSGTGSATQAPVTEPPSGSQPAARGGTAVAQQVAGSATKEESRADRVRSSPLVRRLAQEYGINLADVSGTGIGGRVSKSDIIQYVEQRDQHEVAAATPTAAGPATAATGTAPPVAPARPQPSLPAQPTTARKPGVNEEVVPVSPLRKMIADRMVLSKFSIPHAMTMAEVDVTSVVRYRESKKDEFRKSEGIPLSYVAFVIKATVDALKRFPTVNSEWAGDSIILKRDININVAVDAPDGLTTPVIHHADEKSLAGLSRSIYDLAIRAQQKKLKIEDMQSGTFTVNNTGALGSTGGFSIINYPQAGILSFAAIVKRPVVLEQDGADVIAIRSMMNLSFSFDHRILDGGTATSFVNALKSTLESWPADYPLY